MTVYDLIRQIGILDAAQDSENFPLRVASENNGFTGSLLCVDGRTRLPMPTDVCDFYSYREGWRLRAIDLEWPTTGDMARTLAEPAIDRMLTLDIDQGLLLVPGMKRSNTALLAFDYLPAVFQRAYLVLGDGDNYRVIDAGAEVVCYPDLVSYLAFWRDVLKAA